MEWQWLCVLVCAVASIRPSNTAKLIASRKFANQLQELVDQLQLDVEALRSMDYGVQDPHVSALSNLDLQEIADDNPMCHIITFQKRLESLYNVAGNCLRDIVFEDCCQPLFLSLKTTGIYPIENGRNGFAYCDQTTDGGGWVVVARRDGGRRSFDKTWKQYKRGFGPLDKDFWIGLESLSYLASPSLDTELRFDMREANGSVYHAYYSHFSVGPESDNYRLTVRGFDLEKSTVPYEGFSEHDGYPFSTKDNINLADLQSLCVRRVNSSNGGWWFVEHDDFCARTSINYGYFGYDRETGKIEPKGIPWYSADMTEHKLFLSIEMKIRPKQWRCGNRPRFSWEYIQHQFLNRGSEEEEEDEQPATTTPEPNPTMSTSPPDDGSGSTLPTTTTLPLLPLAVLAPSPLRKD